MFGTFKAAVLVLRYWEGQKEIKKRRKVLCFNNENRRSLVKDAVIKNDHNIYRIIV